MKKLALSLMFLLMLGALSGCPNQQPTLETPTEVVTVAEVTPQIGGFDFDIDLGAEKGYGPGDIVSSMKFMAAALKVQLLYPNAEEYLEWQAPIINGVGHAECYGVLPGDYQITATLVDANGYDLFYGAGPITVKAGVNNKATVIVRPLSVYLFDFVLADLPGTYGPAAEIFRHTAILEEDGRVSQVWWNYLKDGVVFTAALPLDFQGGKMLVTDIAGQQFDVTVPPIPATTDWSTFHFGEAMLIDNNTTLDVTVEIASAVVAPPVDENGKLLPTMKASTAANNTVDVVVEVGDYVCVDANWYVAPHSAGMYPGYYCLDYVISGYHYFVFDVVPGKTYNIPKPDSISWEWAMYIRGEIINQSFDDSKVVATLNGSPMSYDRYYWLLP